MIMSLAKGMTFLFMLIVVVVGMGKTLEWSFGVIDRFQPLGRFSPFLKLAVFFALPIICGGIIGILGEMIL